MRLIQSRLEKLPIFTPEEKPNKVYIGTDTVYNAAGFISAEVQPLSDNTMAEHYGVNILRSVQLFALPDTDIRERYRFEYGGDMYVVKGVSRFPDRIKGVAEKV